MSRLDIFIDRMISQRACIDFAAAKTAHLSGPVFELGLGNGRTFDHMRAIMPHQDIFVFERSIASNPDSTPENEMTILGDVLETLPEAYSRFGATARLIHADLGGHNLQKNIEFAKKISPRIERLLAPEGLMVSSDQMFFSELIAHDLPVNAVAGRCFIYKRLKQKT